MNAQTKPFDMDSLLDGTLDDLADLPEFKPFPAGAHKVLMNLSRKKIGTHDAFELKLIAVETVELIDPNAIPLVKGAECSTAFMLDNEIGQGKFKKFMATIKERFPDTQSVRELIEEVSNLEAVVVTSLREDKKKPGIFYIDIETVMFE